jgi:hypothetical protein
MVVSRLSIAKPRNANLPIGGRQDANRVIGVPGDSILCLLDLVICKERIDANSVPIAAISCTIRF